MTLFSLDSDIVDRKYDFMRRRAEKLCSAVAVVIGIVKKIQRRMSTSEYISLLSGITSNISVMKLLPNDLDAERFYRF